VAAVGKAGSNCDQMAELLSKSRVAEYLKAGSSVVTVARGVVDLLTSGVWAGLIALLS
jgi:hypothetical protein